MDNYFEGFIGHDEIKNEGTRIINQWKDYKKYTNSNIDLIHGINLVGEPGTGKTLFVKLFIKALGFKTFYISDNNENLAFEINDVFNKAKEANEPTIIVFDELDKALNKNLTATRALLTNLDGCLKNNSSIFISTCNSTYELETSLFRRGRFDRQFNVGNPNNETKEELLKYYAKLYNKEIAAEVVKQVIAYLNITSSVDCKALINEAALRYFESKELTFEMLEETNNALSNDFNNIKYDKNKINITIAYHEIGHSMIINKYKNDYTLYKIKLDINQNIGVCYKANNIEHYTNLKQIIKEIEINLAGKVCEELFTNNISAGSYDDIRRANSLAKKLIKEAGYKGADKCLSHYRDMVNISNFKRYKNERLAAKIIKKAINNDKRYLTKNKKVIIKLANLLHVNGSLSQGDFYNAINNI